VRVETRVIVERNSKSAGSNRLYLGGSRTDSVLSNQSTDARCVQLGWVLEVLGVRADRTEREILSNEGVVRCERGISRLVEHQQKRCVIIVVQEVETVEVIKGVVVTVTRVVTFSVISIEMLKYVS
jgi:hypothetical protein